MRKEKFIVHGKIILVFSLFLMFFLISDALPARGTDYPTKPIELLCGQKAGGSTDLSARVLASVIPKYLGQPVVVVNKTGAAGMLAVNHFLKTKPDGYTMMEATIGYLTIFPALHRKSPFTYNSLKAVARTEVVPAVLVTRPDKRWNNLGQFVEFIKTNPGALKYAISAMGSLSDLGAKTFMTQAGIPMKNAIGVPFNGTAEALASVLGKHTDYSYLNLTPLFEHLKAGKLVALGVSTPSRLKSLPKVPTLTELGYPEASIMGWKGIMGHPHLPSEIVKVWEEAIQKMIKDKSWVRFQRKLGSLPAYLGHENFTTFIEKEYSKFRKIAVENNLLVD
ncbi:MAG: Bug family tripartite tricarboxylate transporter substrate binding protein [Candidatus Hodarchaeota archaeon]